MLVQTNCRILEQQFKNILRFFNLITYRKLIKWYKNQTFDLRCSKRKHERNILIYYFIRTMTFDATEMNLIEIKLLFQLQTR